MTEFENWFNQNKDLLFTYREDSYKVGWLAALKWTLTQAYLDDNCYIIIDVQDIEEELKELNNE